MSLKKWPRPHKEVTLTEYTVGWGSTPITTAGLGARREYGLRACATLEPGMEEFLRHSQSWRSWLPFSFICFICFLSILYSRDLAEIYKISTGFVILGIISKFNKND